MKTLIMFCLCALTAYAENKFELHVHVAQNAKVSVAGRPTTSTGTFRIFALHPDFRSFGTVEIRAEIPHKGQTYEFIHNLDITDGADTYSLELDDLSKFSPVGTTPRTTQGAGSAFSTTTQQGVSGSPAPADTSRAKGTTATVTVTVPEKAEVRIDGSSAQSVGTLRTFVLSDLRAKQAALIDIEVEAIVDGKLLHRAQTLQVLAGDVHKLDFSDLGQSNSPKSTPADTQAIDPNAFPEPITLITGAAPSNRAPRQNTGDEDVLPLPATQLPADTAKPLVTPVEVEQRFPLMVTSVPDSCAQFSFRYEKKNLLSVYAIAVGDEEPVLLLELLGPKAIACLDETIAFSASRFINSKENAEELLPGENKVVFFQQGKILHAETLSQHPDSIEVQKSLDGLNIFRVQLNDSKAKRLGYTLDFSIDGRAHSTGPRPRSTPDKFWLQTRESP